MPRPPLDSFWVNRIREIAAAEPKLGSSQIAARLADEAKALGRDDYPSTRTVDRKRSPKHYGDQRNYRLVHWPESFPRDLPWEAAPAVVELLRVTLRRGGERPPVRLAQWFWRVTQIHPESDFQWRLSAGAMLAAADMSPDRDPTALQLLRKLEATVVEDPNLALPELTVVRYRGGRDELLAILGVAGLATVAPSLTRAKAKRDDDKSPETENQR